MRHRSSTAAPGGGARPAPAQLHAPWPCPAPRPQKRRSSGLDSEPLVSGGGHNKQVTPDSTPGRSSGGGGGSKSAGGTPGDVRMLADSLELGLGLQPQSRPLHTKLEHRGQAHRSVQLAAHTSSGELDSKQAVSSPR